MPREEFVFRQDPQNWQATPMAEVVPPPGQGLEKDSLLSKALDPKTTVPLGLGAGGTRAAWNYYKDTSLADTLNNVAKANNIRSEVDLRQALKTAPVVSTKDVAGMVGSGGSYKQWAGTPAGQAQFPLGVQVVSPEVIQYHKVVDDIIKNTNNSFGDAGLPPIGPNRRALTRSLNSYIKGTPLVNGVLPLPGTAGGPSIDKFLREVPGTPSELRNAYNSTQQVRRSGRPANRLPIVVSKPGFVPKGDAYRSALRRGKNPSPNMLSSAQQLVESRARILSPTTGTPITKTRLVDPGRTVKQRLVELGTVNPVTKQINFDVNIPNKGHLTVAPRGGKTRIMRPLGIGLGAGIGASLLRNFLKGRASKPAETYVPPVLPAPVTE